jgi:hypothetical protein
VTCEKKTPRSDVMVLLGSKYPNQLLNGAVHKVLFSDSTVVQFVNADYDNRVQDEQQVF